MVKSALELVRMLDAPDKSKAIPYLKFSLTAQQLREVAAQVSPGKKVPFSPADLQNWVKRGYLPKQQKGAKQITSYEAANILLFADLKDVLGLEGASQLLRFINGDPQSTDDDLIAPERLYEYYAQVYDATAQSWEERMGQRVSAAREAVENETLSAEQKEQLTAALVVLTLGAQADLYRQLALEWLEAVREISPNLAGEADA